MENASKALIMAGGILIALLVIGALLLMINRVGIYSRSQDDDKKYTQLSDFNRDFERYCDDKGINGTDIISLINKVNNYNSKANEDGVINSVDYSIKMELKVTGLDKFNSNYANSESDKLFKNDDLEIKVTSGNTVKNRVRDILDTIKEAAKAESVLGIGNLKKLSAIYDFSKNESENINPIKEKLMEIDKNTYSSWNGSNPSLNIIKKYRQYSEFKSSTFKIAEEGPQYKNGQIYKLHFKFVVE